MKVMAIGTLKPLTPDQRRSHMPKEVPATLKLYLDGKMEQPKLRMLPSVMGGPAGCFMSAGYRKDGLRENPSWQVINDALGLAVPR